jgi:nicotinamidase-related amidase
MMSTVLSKSMEAGKELYSKRGFQHRIGYGSNPAIINIDLANAWTREGSAFTCVEMDQVISNVCKLLQVARSRKIPIFYTTTAYEETMVDAGMWKRKIPALAELQLGSEKVEIDSRLERREDEMVIVKKMASAFAGTGLSTMLTSLGVDTAIITGVTACTCVRHTAEDAVTLGFRPIIPEGTVSDRVPGAVDWNLFDIDAKFGDVEPMENVLEYLKKVPVT